MLTPGVDELLKDARLVVEYAARAGRLPDEALPKAIAVVEHASTSQAVGSQDIASLTSELNIVVRAIAPMTLIDLRAGRSPFDPRNQKAAALMQIFLSSLCVLLIFAAAFLTQLLNQGGTALKAIQEVQDAHPLEKLTTTRKMAQSLAVFGKNDPSYDLYRKYLQDLRDLQDKIISSYQMADAVAKVAQEIFGAIAFLAPVEASQDSPAVPPYPNTASDMKSSRDDAKHSWVNGVNTDLLDDMQFVASIHLTFNSLSMPPTSLLMHTIQANMAFLNGWLFPLLYGLLGAAVFLMRSLLDPRTPNVGFFPALLRLALGGIAGIIIGWFWMPATSQPAEVAAISLTPFGLAFFAGFSIDILFALLDRLNRAAIDTLGPALHRSAQDRAPA